MIVQLTELEQELTEQLQAAESRLANAKKDMQSAEKQLKSLREQQNTAKSLIEVAKQLSQLRSQTPLSSENPFTGSPFKDEDADAEYKVTINRISAQIDHYKHTFQRMQRLYTNAKSAVSTTQQQVDKLEEQLKQARPTIRRHTVTLKDERGHETTFTVAFRADTPMPWGEDGPDEYRFKKIRNRIALFVLLVTLIMPWVPVPEKEGDEISEIPPRLVQLIKEKEIPPPKPKKKDVEVEKVAENKELKPKKKKPKPDVEVTKKAREVASRSGLLAYSDTFTALMDNDADEKLGLQAKLTSGGDQVLATERSLITSSVRTGSGGVNTASLSRDTGGIGLGDKGGSTRVTGVIGGESFNNTDRPLSDSYKGSRTDEEIQLVFDRNKSILYRIYQRELRKNPTLQGKIVLRITIEPSGAVSMSKVDSSDLGHPVLENKIAIRVKRFNFGEKDVDAITITFPIDFLPA